MASHLPFELPSDTRQLAYAESDWQLDSNASDESQDDLLLLSGEAWPVSRGRNRSVSSRGDGHRALPQLKLSDFSADELDGLDSGLRSRISQSSAYASAYPTAVPTSSYADQFYEHNMPLSAATMHASMCHHHGLPRPRPPTRSAPRLQAHVEHQQVQHLQRMCMQLEQRNLACLHEIEALKRQPAPWGPEPSELQRAWEAQEHTSNAAAGASYLDMRRTSRC